MKRQQNYMVELDSGQPEQDFDQNKNFIKNIQTAVLLSLLEKGQLTKRQFDFCMDKLNVS